MITLECIHQEAEKLAQQTYDFIHRPVEVAVNEHVVTSISDHISKGTGGTLSYVCFSKNGPMEAIEVALLAPRKNVETDNATYDDTKMDLYATSDTNASQFEEGFSLSGRIDLDEGSANSFPDGLSGLLRASLGDIPVEINRMGACVIHCSYGDLTIIPRMALGNERTQTFPDTFEMSIPGMEKLNKIQLSAMIAEYAKILEVMLNNLFAMSGQVPDSVSLSQVHEVSFPHRLSSRVAFEGEIPWKVFFQIRDHTIIASSDYDRRGANGVPRSATEQEQIGFTQFGLYAYARNMYKSWTQKDLDDYVATHEDITCEEARIALTVNNFNRVFSYILNAKPEGKRQ